MHGASRRFPPTCCGRWISSPVYREPAGQERLLSTRGSPVGSRAPRGEDTSEPVPRQRRGRVGMSGQGKHPIGCLFAWCITGLLSSTRCSKYAMAPMLHHRQSCRRGQTRSVCPAGASRRGAADGAAASQQSVALNGRVATPRRPTSPESENNLVRFLLCIDFQHTRALRHCRGLR